MIYGANKDGVRDILFTFDDGPHATHTPKLLDILAEHEVKALFFVLGNRLESEAGQRVIQRASEEGHVIGNHTYTHPNLKKLSDDQIRAEVQRTAQLIGGADRGIKVFRPPYGAHDARVDRIVRELGYEIMLWSVDSLDWDPEYKQGGWVEHALKQIRQREDSVFLAHDIHATTVSRVPELIAGVKGVERAAFARYGTAPTVA